MLATRTRKMKNSPHASAGLWRAPALALMLALGLVPLALGLAGCAGSAESAPAGQRMIVLGFDGMDYALTRQLMAAGRLPNLARLAREGSFAPLETSVPPQSPVAWSNFITGMDSGGHGIFDFIHRHPDTLLPYLSTSEVVPPEHFLHLGKYQVPLGGGQVRLLRHGRPFWDVLEQAGIATTIVRMPANFPPSGLATRELSGMGTPDFLGTPGTFSFYTSELFAFYGEEVTGGEVYEVFVEDDKVEAELHGPDNPFLREPQKVTAPFTVYIDPDRPLARIAVGDSDVLLAEGEWSGWIPVSFDLVPTQSIQAICRFYLKQVRPELELYVTPLQIDPEAPIMPISHPEDYAAHLAEEIGHGYYTQEMPEDTKAYVHGIFTVDEFLAQAKLAGEHVVGQLDVALDEFDTGLLFYYFGNLDQISHMMWKTMDPTHPAWDPERDPAYADVIPKIYEQFDGIVGHVLARMGEGTQLVVMSDHGFTSWKRSFHLNTWLRENGYLGVLNPSRRTDSGYFTNVDWGKTRAYALGLNGLYLNLRGREPNGIVDPGEREALLAEIGAKLLATVDPGTGGPAVTRVYPSAEYYTEKDYLSRGPDLQVGYAKGTRASNESSLGGLTEEIITDNLSPWSGDHCMDHTAVPGVLFSNRPLKRPATSLKDLAASILAEFGVEGGFPSPEPGG